MKGSKIARFSHHHSRSVFKASSSPRHPQYLPLQDRYRQIEHKSKQCSTSNFPFKLGFYDTWSIVKPKTGMGLRPAVTQAFLDTFDSVGINTRNPAKQRHLEHLINLYTGFDSISHIKYMLSDTTFNVHPLKELIDEFTEAKRYAVHKTINERFKSYLKTFLEDPMYCSIDPNLLKVNDQLKQLGFKYFGITTELDEDMYNIVGSHMQSQGFIPDVASSNVVGALRSSYSGFLNPNECFQLSSGFVGIVEAKRAKCISIGVSTDPVIRKQMYAISVDYAISNISQLPWIFDPTNRGTHGSVYDWHEEQNVLRNYVKY
jgi:hypothetical protein